MPCGLSEGLPVGPAADRRRLVRGAPVRARPRLRGADRPAPTGATSSRPSSRSPPTRDADAGRPRRRSLVGDRRPDASSCDLRHSPATRRVGRSLAAGGTTMRRSIRRPARCPGPSSRHRHSGAYRRVPPGRGRWYETLGRSIPTRPAAPARRRAHRRTRTASRDSGDHDRRAAPRPSGRGSSRWAIGRGRLVQLSTSDGHARHERDDDRSRVAVDRGRRHHAGRLPRAASRSSRSSRSERSVLVHRRRHRRAATWRGLAIGSPAAERIPVGLARVGGDPRHAGVVVRARPGRSCSSRSTACRPGSSSAPASSTRWPGPMTSVVQRVHGLRRVRDDRSAS